MKRRNNGGFSLLEIIIALGIFVMGASTLTVLVFAGHFGTQQGGDIILAESLAQEALEATRTIRDEDWSNILDGVHGLSTSGGAWAFSGTSELIDSKFTRSVTISHIATGTKAVLAQVEWQNQSGQTKAIRYNSRITDWRTVDDNGTTEVDIGTTGTSLHVEGSYAYLGTDDRDQTAIIFDVSSPMTPVQVGVYDNNSEADDVILDGDYLFVATRQNNSVRVLDVSIPSSPVDVASISVGQNPNALDIYAGYLYVGRDHPNWGIRAYNISDPENPVWTNSYYTGVAVNDLKVEPPYIFYSYNLGRGFDTRPGYAHVAVADDDTGYQVYTIPTINLRNSEDIGGQGRDTFVLGDTVYVGSATPNQGIVMYDITGDDEDPTFIQYVDIGGGVNAVYVDGGYIYNAVDRLDAGFVVTPVP